MDTDRARRESPFKAPIAHGFLTLSLLPHFMQQALQIKQWRSPWRELWLEPGAVCFTSALPARTFAPALYIAIVKRSDRRSRGRVQRHSGSGRRNKTGLRGRVGSAVLQIGFLKSRAQRGITITLMNHMSCRIWTNFLAGNLPVIGFPRYARDFTGQRSYKPALFVAFNPTLINVFATSPSEANLSSFVRP